MTSSTLIYPTAPWSSDPANRSRYLHSSIDFQLPSGERWSVWLTSTARWRDGSRVGLDWGVSAGPSKRYPVAAAFCVFHAEDVEEAMEIANIVRGRLLMAGELGLHRGLSQAFKPTGFYADSVVLEEGKHLEGYKAFIEESRRQQDA